MAKGKTESRGVQRRESEGPNSWRCIWCGAAVPEGYGLCAPCLSNWEVDHEDSIETLELKVKSGVSLDGYDRARLRLARSDQKKPLGEREREVIAAMRELGAVDETHRVTGNKIAFKAAGPEADRDEFRRALASLKQRGMIESCKGQEGGYWLTGR